MKILSLAILLCSLIGLPSVCFGGLIQLKDIEGTWTRQKYIETVRTTRSPFADRPETITIKDNTLSWVSYHEGSWRKIIRIEDNKTEGVCRLMVGKWEENVPGSELIEVPFKPVAGGDGKIERIIFLNNTIVEHAQEPFFRLDLPLEKLIGQIVLAGIYQDEKGQQYTFEESGTAIWPDLSFSYEVALDSTEAFCDYFLVNYEKNRVNTKTYGFKWVSNKLELFEIKSKEWGVNCADKPFAILTPRRH